MKNIVAIGGGHGLSTILKGIRQIDDINISAIITVADEGGSTGRLRKRYTIPAMGDIRANMLALSNCSPVLCDLMNYRFEGEDNMDIAGHSLGNLILTALTNMSGSFSKAIDTTAELLQVEGRIIPATLENVTLYARMDDDTIVKGENNIPSLLHNINEVFYMKNVKANDEAIEVIEKADLIIYGIGSLYTSILPNTIIPGISTALNKTKAKKVYFANCMSQSNETYNYDLKDHIEALQKHHTPIDLVITHNNVIPEDILYKYTLKNSIEIKNNNNIDVQVRSYDILTFDSGLVRHDPDKIRKVVEELL